jgi:hypothetical protein
MSFSASGVSHSFNYLLTYVITMVSTQHICSICREPRSKSYHRKHPLKQGDRPIPGVCRRCMPCKVDTLIIVVHHHYPPQTTAEATQAPDICRRLAELPDNQVNRGCQELPADLYAWARAEEGPPVVHYGNKPKFER